MSMLLARGLAASVLLLPALASAEVFINELHYDNASTDVGEFVEVVATAGENLSLYSLHFYNGGTGALSTSTSPNPQSLVAGSSVACGATVQMSVLAPNQIENGGPDGIALVGPDGVVQFLSYEGQFTGSAGPASGMASLDIGVAETGSTLAGSSLQLGGNGTGYDTFSWNGSATETPGACNNAQTFGAPVDDPPTLDGSTPANGTMDVLVSSDIELEFSEPVTTTATWFTLDCGGTIPADVDGSGATRVISPVDDLPFETACTLTLIAANILDADGATHDPLAGDNVVGFTTAADVAPSVQTITPAHEASGVAVNANVAIAFSEAVVTTAPWIEVTCVPSGPHPGAITGSGSNRQFDPTVNFSPGDACSVTLTPANIVDQGGGAQPLAGQSVFTFDVAPDLAPSIAATFPAQGATNVAVGSELSVTFSEPVTADAGAFAIACGATAHPFTQSHVAQTTYTLDPDDDFAMDADCTLVIDAGFIFDIDGSPNGLDAGATIVFTTSAGTAGYYERVDTSSCRAMRATLHGVIDDHVSYSYDPRSGPNNDTWEILEPADQDPTSPGMILDIYENKKFTKVTERTGSSNCTGSYNREHTWPKSLGFPSESGDLGLPNAPHTDGHMLYLSNCTYNSARNNSPYRDCPTCTSTNATMTNHGVGGGGDNNRYSGSVYQVWSKRRGDAARAVLYMDIRYEGGRHAFTGQSEPDLVLGYGSDAGTPGSLDTLLAWHNADPPFVVGSSAPLDNVEVLRNDVMESFQDNRNPLIDHPEWAATLFASPCNGPVVVAVDDDYAVASGATLSRPAIAPLPNTDPGRTVPGVLINDHNGGNKNGQGLTASLAVQAQHGSAAITDGPTGAFTYTSTPGYCGPDQFTYQVSNGTDIDQAVVHIDVTEPGCSSTPNQPPEITASTGATIPENSTAGTSAGQITATDPDAGTTLIYDITAGNGGGAFAISNSGAITVNNTALLDFETSPTFTLTVRVRDGAGPGALSDTAQVTIHLDNANEAPSASNATFPLAENAPGGTIVGAVSASDPDTGTSLVYSIAAGNNSGAFGMVGNSIVVADPAPLDFETSPQFVLTVEVSDGTLDTTAQITINLGNVNEAPSASNATFPLAENAAGGTIVGTVSASDPDTGTSLVYSIAAGNSGGAFGMVGNSIVVADPAPLDFETSPQFVLTVEVSDGTLDTTAQVTINLTNGSEPATAQDDTAELDEDASSVALDVRDNDLAGEDGLVIVSVGAASHGTATFDSDDVYYTPAPDFCGSDSVSYTLQGGSSATVSIDVACVNDAPVVAEELLDREAQEGVQIVAFSIGGGFDDIDTGDTLEFSQTGLPSGLVLDATTGTISGTPATGSAAGSVYTVVITASDGEASVQQSFEYTVAPGTALPEAIFDDGFEN